MQHAAGAAPQRMKMGELGGVPPSPPACGSIFTGVSQCLPAWNYGC